MESDKRCKDLNKEKVVAILRCGVRREIESFTWEFGSILERENILQEFSLHLVLLEK